MKQNFGKEPYRSTWINFKIHPKSKLAVKSDPFILIIINFLSASFFVPKQFLSLMRIVLCFNGKKTYPCSFAWLVVTELLCTSLQNVGNFFSSDWLVGGFVDRDCHKIFLNCSSSEQSFCQTISFRHDYVSNLCS